MGMLQNADTHEILLIVISKSISRPNPKLKVTSFGTVNSFVERFSESEKYFCTSLFETIPKYAKINVKCALDVFTEAIVNR